MPRSKFLTDLLRVLDIFVLGGAYLEDTIDDGFLADGKVGGFFLSGKSFTILVLLELLSILNF